MNKILKIAITASLGLLFSQTVLADPVIELDNKNADHCIQQLEKSKEQFPVILIYSSHCDFTPIFMPTFDKVANSSGQRGRSFFRIDYNKGDGKSIRQCLGMIENSVLASPTVTLVIQLEDSVSGKIIRSHPLRAWGGVKLDPKSGNPISISTEELERIIDLEYGKMIKKQLLKNLSSTQYG